MLEAEVKVKINISDAEKVILGLGFVKGNRVYEKDTYFNSRLKDLKAEDKALRIREHHDMALDDSIYIMNFKGPKIDDDTMSREETEFEIPSFEQGETMLKGLGFSPAGYVEKVRVHYQKECSIPSGQKKMIMTCCLDKVTGLGEFMELEIMTEEEGYEDAISIIRNLLDRFGLDLKDTITHSYLSMLMSK